MGLPAQAQKAVGTDGSRHNRQITRCEKDGLESEHGELETTDRYDVMQSISGDMY